jgi:dihydrofolate synthase / folylpolyglutamate synthase
MFSTYQDTLRFLYDNLPMFQRIGAAALKNDLSNTWKLCALLDNPQTKFSSIHVAGTNGKGSTSHMLASVLQSAGYKTGLYTSPHLKDFTERIRIDGMAITPDYIIQFVNRLRPAIEEIKPSFFEITVVMAFEYFASMRVDVAVIEVGLGGRLDSTNVITPELSVITNIGWDHKDILGDTLQKIASEKAGIIKPGIPVVVSERQNGIDEVFMKKSEETRSPIVFATDEYHCVQRVHRDKHSLDIYHKNKLLLEELVLPLQGSYQRKNILGVLKSVDVLRELGRKINKQDLLNGLKRVVSQTGLKGRWQILGKKPLKVCDTGHNPDGITEVVNQIRDQSYARLHIVLGVVKDKDVTQVLGLLPDDASYYFCQAKIPRAMDAHQLAELATALGRRGRIVPDVNDAIREAEKSASPEDMIFIGGSTFVVAEIENL